MNIKIGLVVFMPVVIVVNGETIISCTTNEDCISATTEIERIENDSPQQQQYYCAQGHCLEFGSCYNDMDCRNPANTIITTPDALVGCADPTPDMYMYCDANNTDGGFSRAEIIGSCTTGCRLGQCPDGSNFVNCFADPCGVVLSNPCGDVCISDYCGGCNAIQLDAAGFEVDCDATSSPQENNNTSSPTPPANNTTPPVNITCQDTNDCLQEEQYCSSDGSCYAYGTCGHDLDCDNRDNMYHVPLFGCVDPPVEAIVCNEVGRCQKICVDDKESSKTLSNNNSSSSSPTNSPMMMIIKVVMIFGSIFLLPVVG